jgi:hypothetical protein
VTAFFWIMLAGTAAFAALGYVAPYVALTGLAFATAVMVALSRSVGGRR